MLALLSVAETCGYAVTWREPRLRRAGTTLLQLAASGISGATAALVAVVLVAFRIAAGRDHTRLVGRRGGSESAAAITASAPGLSGCPRSVR